jgi:serine/threonine protein kinase
MDLADGGELFDNVANSQRFTERDAQAAVQGVLLGLAVLHNSGLAHGRLVPTAVLLQERHNFAKVMISDPLLLRGRGGGGREEECEESSEDAGGFAASAAPTSAPAGGAEAALGAGETTASPDYPATLDSRTARYGQRPTMPGFCAPEGFGDSSFDGGLPHVGCPADMWAVGVLTYTLLSGYQPFTAASFVRLALMVVKRRRRRRRGGGGGGGEGSWVVELVVVLWLLWY